MGFFDKILNRRAGMLGDTIKDAADKFASDSGKKDKRKFDDKIKDVFEELSGYEIEKNVSVDIIETIACREAYSHKRKIGPQAISYGIKKDGQYVMFIRLWGDYNKYNRSSNREVKRFCDGHKIVMLDFFDYLPNEYQYMLDRIKENIGL